MSLLNVRVVEKTTGEPVVARVHIIDAGGRPVFPADAVRKVGPGLPGFFADGECVTEVPSGYTTVVVEKGTEFEPFRTTVRVSPGASIDVVVPLRRWASLAEQGWYSGNTHIHYDEHESDPDSRLLLDPQAFDLRVTAISHLRRGDIPYATNKYPVGVVNGFCVANRIVDCGEECRHNREAWEIGYGHVLFLGLREPVLPISRGLLVNEADPDYPPLCHACDDARGQGGTVIWCHNGAGLEAPVAAVLGKVDAINLFDPFWVMPEEYSVWYHLLNCGFRLPASTGSDWYVCSNNRVYARVKGEFSYLEWLKALRMGNTFITNGPALWVSANEAGPGDLLEVETDRPLDIEVRWKSCRPISFLELVNNGKVVLSHQVPEEALEGFWRTTYKPTEDGWLAARLWSDRRDTFFQPSFAHISPIWIRGIGQSIARRDSATHFVHALDDSLEWISNVGRFGNAVQRRELLDLFRLALSRFCAMVDSGSDVSEHVR